jgi:hypothetical protein
MCKTQTETAVPILYLVRLPLLVVDMAAVVVTTEEVAALVEVVEFLETLIQEALEIPHLQAHPKVTMVAITAQLVHIRVVVAVVLLRLALMVLEIILETVAMVLRLASQECL